MQKRVVASGFVPSSSLAGRWSTLLGAPLSTLLGAPLSTLLGALLSTLLVTLALAGCGSSKRPSDERAFCVVLDGANGTIRLTDLFAGEEVPTLAEIEKSAQVFSDLDQIAPTAIRPDTTEIVKFMKNDVQELLRLINETDSDDEAVAENASTQIEPYLVRVEKLDTHMANVAKYAKDRCGIELDNSTASN